MGLTSEPTVTLSSDGGYLTLSSKQNKARFHALWLRDNAQDGDTRSPDNGQRLITLLEQPADIRLTQVKCQDDSIHVMFANDDTDYVFPVNWLIKNAYDKAENHQHEPGWLPDNTKTWDQALQNHLPCADYDSLMHDDEALKNWLSNTVALGFAIAEGLPDDPDSMFGVIGRFGFVRETNYGKYFDIRTETNPTNLAFTRLGLQAHTDNPYRDPVPTLQALSCIENTAEGGESIFVDGFHVIHTLKKENPAHFDVLSQYCANFRYAGDDTTDLHATRPMIELNADGELIAMRFNNRSAAPFTRIPFDVMPTYYRAYRHLAEIIERPENEIKFKLGVGQVVVFDNTRILHSRRSFATGGKRWLRGCYADKDGLHSTLAILKQKVIYDD